MQVVTEQLYADEDLSDVMSDALSVASAGSRTTASRSAKAAKPKSNKPPGWMPRADVQENDWVGSMLTAENLAAVA